MNSPIMPGQKTSGTKAASVVQVEGLIDTGAIVALLDRPGAPTATTRRRTAATPGAGGVTGLAGHVPPYPDALVAPCSRGYEVDVHFDAEARVKASNCRRNQRAVDARSGVFPLGKMGDL